jgi:tetratricopeptide (TPR) repeat protein
MGSLLEERFSDKQFVYKDGGLVFFHASLSDWLKDPRRSGVHTVGNTQELTDFLLQQLKEATAGFYPEDIYPQSDGWKSCSRCQWDGYFQAWLPYLIKDSPYWSNATAISLVASVLSRHWMDSQKAVELRKRQIFIAQNSEEFAESLILGLAELANDLRRLGNDEESKKCLSDARDILASESFTKVRFSILKRLTEAAFAHMQETVSIPTTISIEKYASRMYGEYSLETAAALVDKAEAWWDIGDYENTEECYARASSILLRYCPDGCPELAKVLNELAHLYLKHDAKKLVQLNQKYARFLSEASKPTDAH